MSYINTLSATILNNISNHFSSHYHGTVTLYESLQFFSKQASMPRRLVGVPGYSLADGNIYADTETHVNFCIVAQRFWLICVQFPSATAMKCINFCDDCLTTDKQHVQLCTGLVCKPEAASCLGILINNFIYTYIYNLLFIDPTTNFVGELQGFLELPGEFLSRSFKCTYRAGLDATPHFLLFLYEPTPSRSSEPTNSTSSQ